MKSITAKNIHKSFGGKPVLAGVNFTISQGNRLALIGENGSGKSTLLNIITGHLMPDHGELFGNELSCVLIAQDFSGKDDETPLKFLERRVQVIHRAVKLLGESGESRIGHTPEVRGQSRLASKNRR